MRFLLALLIGMVAQGVAAQETPPSPIVRAELAVNAKADAIDAAVTFTMPEHWHIYWKNPGDTGIATSLVWDLPKGITAGEIVWPAPERIEMSGLINYGYSNQVTLPVKLTPVSANIAGIARVKASWLVCKDICIPESAELVAPLSPNADAEALAKRALEHAPKRFEGHAVYDRSDEKVAITFTQAEPWGEIEQVRFSPVEDGIAANHPAPEFTVDGEKLLLRLVKGTADTVPQWHGVLHLMRAGKETAFDVTATYGAALDTLPMPAPAMQATEVPPTLMVALLLAFVGGLILNIMPCVLPILALKALALSKKATASRRAAAMQGVSYTAGVIASFLLIAGGMLALKASGSAIGWGFQLQNPFFVGFLALVMLLVALNLLGMFALPVLFGTRATGVNEEKFGGSFLTGALAVLVATPCTAPFMATALGATLSMPTVQAVLVFAALGLGMASPFLLISLWPAARRLIPKPGAWMHRFKHILAIPMLATGAWLIYVLLQIMNPAPVVKTDIYEAYSAARLSALREERRPVLVDATAAWCISCKVNERVALKPEAMQQFFREKKLVILVADWTNSDPAITEYLAGFGRNGVPLYVYYPPDRAPMVLPQILTPQIVRSAIESGEK